MILSLVGGLFLSLIAADGGGWWPDTLSETQVVAVLEEAGWPAEQIPGAVAVAFCESRYNRLASGDGGRSLGLFQLWSGWFEYAGLPHIWFDPVMNARAALVAFNYGVQRGQGPWSQWSCKPPG